MNIQPAGHKILVKPKAVETVTKSGIILQVESERYLEATTEGEVIAVGPTAYLKVDDGRPWVKVGDKIIYGKYAGALVLDPNTQEKYVVIHDLDVVAILN